MLKKCTLWYIKWCKYKFRSHEIFGISNSDSNINMIWLTSHLISIWYDYGIVSYDTGLYILSDVNVFIFCDAFCDCLACRTFEIARGSWDVVVCPIYMCLTVYEFSFFCLIFVYSSQYSILFWIMYLLWHFGYLPNINATIELFIL